MTIESAARELLGVRWHHQGRSATLGVDCLGLGVVVLQANGYEVRDRTDYGPDPNGELRKELTRNLGPEVTGSPLEAGDIVLMEFSRHKPRHIGIVASCHFGLTIIHADNSARRVVEHSIDDRWMRRIVGVWRAAA